MFPIREILYLLRHLPEAGPSGLHSSWCGAAARGTLWFCVCQLLLLSPVLAQGNIQVSEAEITGPYLNLAENHAGEFHLRRDERAVHVAFGSARSPVQYFARGQPEVLFTIPEGFRPATAVTWEVTARHVQSDGTPHPTRSGPHVFRMTVDPEGHVRYVDDPGVEGVGYLSYHTAWAWPLASTDPLVCERSWGVRQRILATLADLGEGVVSCDQVGWDHLAHIRTWSSQEPITIQHWYQRPAVWRGIPESVSREVPDGQYRYQDPYLWPPFPYWKTDPPLPREYGFVQPHDLLGLTNLTELHVEVDSDSSFPPGLLVHTPRLLALSVAQYDTWSDLPSMPRDFLAYTPLLRHLSLGKFSDALLLDWTEDALARTPHLTSLRLGLRRPTDKVFELLQHAPQLTRLILDGLAEPLPADSLAHLSHLTHLTVEGGFNPCEAPALQLPTTLADFALRLVVEGSQVACLDDSLADHWLTHAPALTRLSVDLHGLANLDTDVLPSLPALTRLTLDVAGVTALPPRLLADLPHLTHLQLHESSSEGTDASLDLPADLLAGSPHLIELSLDMPRLRHIPAELLVPVPNLQRLYLNAPRLESLSDGFTDNMSQLTDVSIVLPCDLDRLPDDFLTHTPQLQSLYLGTERCFGLEPPGPKFLPEQFLSDTQQLTHLWLNLRGLLELPSSFLTHVPQLQHLELEYIHGKHGKFIYELRSLPAHFLENAPNLTYLDLWPVVQLLELPADFLARSSRLRHLYLDLNGLSVLPDGFLTQVPNLQRLELDLRQVDALPDDFLAHTPGLSDVKVDVNNVDVLPEGYLAHAPGLTHLDMRAKNVTRLPEGFLAHSPRIETLGLGLPGLTSPPKPGDALWNTLHSKGIHVTVTDLSKLMPDMRNYYCDLMADRVSEPEKIYKSDQIFDVVWHELDDEGNVQLIVYPWTGQGLFFYWYERGFCSFVIDQRFTIPSVDV